MYWGVYWGCTEGVLGLYCGDCGVLGSTESTGGVLGVYCGCTGRLLKARHPKAGGKDDGGEREGGGRGREGIQPSLTIEGHPTGQR